MDVERIKNKELAKLIVTLPSYEAKKGDPGYREYIGWCPGDDYMHSDGGQWSCTQEYDSWEHFIDEMVDADIDMNLVVDFYFSISEDTVNCLVCNGQRYNTATQKIDDDFYDLNQSGRKWAYNITQDEVEALVKEGRLWNIVKRKMFYQENEKQWYTWIKTEDGKNIKVKSDKPDMPTAEYVNKSCKEGSGHDAINRSILVEQRAKRLGVFGFCKECEGEGYISLSEEYLSLYLWHLHPRKGASRGMSIKRVPVNKLDEVKQFLARSIEQHKKHFKWIIE